MRPTQPFTREGVTLRQAALTAGFGLLIMVFATPFAELYVYPKLVIPGQIHQTAQNIVSHRGLFVAGIFGYLLTFTLDVIVAWALYVLLIPVNRALSLLVAWFRLVYAVIALVAVLKLTTVLHLLNAPEYLTAFGSDQLHAQVKLLLNSFGYVWSMSFVFFGICLGLLGYLVYRSGYIPKVMGVLLAVSGAGYLLNEGLRPYLFPDVDLGFLMVTYFGELIFMLWLLLRGWKIEEPRTP